LRHIDSARHVKLRHYPVRAAIVADRRAKEHQAVAESADRSAKYWRAKAEWAGASAPYAKAFALGGTSEVVAQGIMLDAAAPRREKGQ